MMPGKLVESPTENPASANNVVQINPDRELVDIQARIQINDTLASGRTKAISPLGIQVRSGTALPPRTPLLLHCTFGQVCYLKLSGQVISCQPSDDQPSWYAIGIKFAALRDWESKILASAIEELKQTLETREQSLVTIIVSKDTLAVEAARLFTEADGVPGQSQGTSACTITPQRTITMRRVVITGIGAVAPNGIGRTAFWNSLAEGKSCIDRISFFDPSGHPSQIAAEVRDFDPHALIPHKEVKRMGRSAHLGIAAATSALDDARLKITTEMKTKLSVIVGTGTSGLEYAEEDFYAIRQGGVRHMRPYAAIAGFGGALSSEISRALGLNGSSITISTGCTGSTDASGQAFNAIRYGLADVVLTGGSDACITPAILGAFCQVGAPSTGFNATPQKASRPFNKDRDGFVLGEGAWIFVFEELSHALSRDATIYGEVVGYAATCDAYHMSRPLPSGDFTAQAMRLALLDAMVKPEDVQYVNAYGNGTKVNDSYETMVIKKVFGDHAARLMVSSTKSMIGHSIGSCGAGALAATLMALSWGIVHPTINYECPDEECDLDYVPNVARRADVRVAMCNTLAFGSKNSVLIVKRFEAQA